MKPVRTKEILSRLHSLASPNAAQAMARFGITAKQAYGISAPVLKSLAKELGKNHERSLELWKTEIYDARVIAYLTDNPAEVTEEQVELWVNDFDSWAICDGCCLYLFGKTSFAWKKAIEWSKREEEYVKRAGYTLMATLAVHDKRAPDSRFHQFFPHIKRGANDERNFVKKAVNWALRQIGKRSLALNAPAIETAQLLKAAKAPSARWAGSDALRELQSAAVQARLKKKAGSPAKQKAQ